MQKIRLIALAMVMIFLMSGCGLKEKINEKVTEGILDQVAGDDADVDVKGDDVTFSSDEGKLTMNDEDGITFEGEDGTVITAGDENEWPSGQAADYIPKFDIGSTCTITYVLNGPDSCMVMLEGSTIEDYKEYKDSIISKGYTENKVDSSAEDMELYSATSADGVVVSVCMIPSVNSLQVTVDASGKK